MTAEWSKYVSTACLVKPCTGRVGVVSKCLAESPLVKHAWGRPLVYVCNLWDSIKCRKMRRLTSDGANVLPLHAMLSHVQEG